jgi:hypothetical protein
VLAAIRRPKVVEPRDTSWGNSSLRVIPTSCRANATNRKRLNQPACAEIDDTGDFVSGEQNVVVPEVAKDGKWNHQVRSPPTLLPPQRDGESGEQTPAASLE